MAVRSINSDDWTLGEFCAGTGMLGVAIETVCSVWFGRRVVPVVYCERDACGAASIVDRMEKTGVGYTPIWDHIATFDGRRWRGCVDIACAGLPCPAYSQAGKRAGNVDARAWGKDGTSGPVPHFLRVVGEMRPPLVFLENVPVWVTGGWFRPVGEELCRLGYTVQDPLFLAAEDVGAPHRRERVFVLAHAHGRRRRAQSHTRKHDGADTGRGKMGDAPDADRRLSTYRSRAGQTPDARGGGVGDASGNQLEGRACIERDNDTERPTAPGAGRLRLFPPGPGLGLAGTVDDIGKLLSRDPHGAWRRYQAELANTLRWRDILREHPEVEPGLPSVVDGLVARSDSLRLGGNGVVPLAAAVAFGYLLFNVPD